MKNSKKRLWAEFLQLACNIDSLSDFIYGNKFMNVDEENRRLLVEQLNAMYEYRDILKKRMELNDIGGKSECIDCM